MSEEKVCPYLEVDEFGESICHNAFEDENDCCPSEYVDTCTVESECDCQGDCNQCNHKFECESSDHYMI